jgi:glycosyltransferase involved in cell wall biosynthesis
VPESGSAIGPNREPAVTVIAPTPPPLTGQSAYSQYLIKMFEPYGLEHIALRGRNAADGWRGYAIKVLSSLRAAARLATGRRRKSVMIVLDGGRGLLFDILYLVIARIRGAERIAVSHHSFAYIDRRRGMMSCLVVIGGPRVVHLFLCEVMKKRFVAVYGSCLTTRVVGNARRYSAPAVVANKHGEGLSLGYLSNISFEKGIAEYFELIDALLAEGVYLSGLIAGPIASAEVEAFVRDCIERCNGRVEWIGAVYGSEKDNFFNRIDILVFPTKYINEAQPNVLLESLAHGVPVVSLARGCIVEDMAESGSLVVESVENFVPEAKRFIEGVLRRRAEMAALAERARRRFDQLSASSRRAESDLIRYMLSVE